jgi:hypothetical protein
LGIGWAVELIFFRSRTFPLLAAELALCAQTVLAGTKKMSLPRMFDRFEVFALLAAELALRAQTVLAGAKQFLLSRMPGS